MTTQEPPRRPTVDEVDSAVGSFRLCGIETPPEAVAILRRYAASELGHDEAIAMIAALPHTPDPGVDLSPEAVSRRRLSDPAWIASMAQELHERDAGISDLLARGADDRPPPGKAE